MANEPISKAKSSCHSKNQEEPEPEKKLTVLESHGYILGKTVGVGTYATVKLADSNRHRCQVAVKVISKFQAPSANLNKFLPREIQVVKNLRHPNLIRYLQAIETTHRVYIIMEFAENGNLLDMVRRDKFIDEERSRRWFSQLLDVMDYCHDKGVVHRDVKCENLLLDRHYNLKLSDFGFARGHMKPVDGVQTLCETYCGSFAYASPEIICGIPYQPQLSDIWSSGVVLYTMVFGRLPFDDTSWSKLRKIEGLIIPESRPMGWNPMRDFHFNMKESHSPSFDKIHDPEGVVLPFQSKVVFPKSPKVSRACRSLILRILVPQRSRPSITEIQRDAWLTVETATAQTSTEEAYFDEAAKSVSGNTVKSLSGKALSAKNSSAKSRKSHRSRKSENNEERVDNEK